MNSHADKNDLFAQFNEAVAALFGALFKRREKAPVVTPALIKLPAPTEATTPAPIAPGSLQRPAFWHQPGLLTPAEAHAALHYINNRHLYKTIQNQVFYR